MANYIGSKFKTDITIDKVYSVHYFEYPKNYKFTGESHNFWEFVYADKSDITVYADTEVYTLKQGNIIFHKPNEWHNVYANSEAATNVAIISFSCNSPAMSFFENKILTVGQEQKTILSKFFLNIPAPSPLPWVTPTPQSLFANLVNPLVQNSLYVSILQNF